MEQGKDICKQLKEIRRSIADENDIPLEDHECTYDGPCKGTCPRCDAEVQYLEKEINRRKGIGLAVLMAGASMSMASMCATSGEIIDPPLEGDVPYFDSSLVEDSTQSQSDAVDYSAGDESPVIVTDGNSDGGANQ